MKLSGSTRCPAPSWSRSSPTASGRERLLEIAGLETALGEHCRRPDTRVAVGLKLEPDRELVGAVGIAALEAGDLAVGPGEVLDVVADLVRTNPK